MDDEKAVKRQAVLADVREHMAKNKEFLPPRIAAVIDDPAYSTQTICDMLHEELEEEAEQGRPTLEANIWKSLLEKIPHSKPN